MYEILVKNSPLNLLSPIKFYVLLGLSRSPKLAELEIQIPHAMACDTCL